MEGEAAHDHATSPIWGVSENGDDRMKLGRFALIGIVVFGVAAMGASAVGYLVAGGSGDGTATVGELAGTESMATSATVDDALHPGGRGDIVLTVRNPNPYPIRVEALEAAAAEVDSDVPGCGVHVGLVDERITLTPPVEIVPDGVAVLPLAGRARMSTATPTECQRARFIVPVTVVVRR